LVTAESSRAVQSTDAETCALHCLYFCSQIRKGMSLRRIEMSYTVNTKVNDCMAFEFYKNLAERKNNVRSRRICAKLLYKFRRNCK
jgi:hypothetical protein